MIKDVIGKLDSYFGEDADYVENRDKWRLLKNERHAYLVCRNWVQKTLQVCKRAHRQELVGVLIEVLVELDDLLKLD